MDTNPLASPIASAPLDLIDSHAHVDMPDFDADREAMLSRAQAAGVGTILAIGGAAFGGSADGDSTGAAAGTTTAPDPAAILGSAIPYAERYSWIYAAAGVHPHEARHATPAVYDALAHLARHPRFLAWGEIGLDYHYDHSPRDIQKRVFIEQLDLAAAARKPIIIHCREAWADCLAILDAHWRPRGLGGILHCFGGTVDEAQKGIELGFLVSFAANVTYPKAQNLRDVAAALPLGSLLIETDSPFLAPQARRGRRNEPANVAEVARTLAPVRNLAAAELAAATAANFRRFFKLGNGHG